MKNFKPDKDDSNFKDNYFQQWHKFINKLQNEDGKNNLTTWWNNVRPLRRTKNITILVLTGVLLIGISLIPVFSKEPSIYDLEKEFNILGGKIYQKQINLKELQIQQADTQIQLAKKKIEAEMKKDKPNTKEVERLSLLIESETMFIGDMEYNKKMEQEVKKN